jgi:hypothetical protein
MRKHSESQKRRRNGKDKEVEREMSRNFNPEYVHSKECKFGCGRTIFWSELKHFYAESADGAIKHQCGKDDTRINSNSATIAQINLARNDLSHQLVVIQEDVAKLRKSVWELHQKIDEINGKISK